MKLIKLDPSFTILNVSHLLLSQPRTDVLGYWTLSQSYCLGCEDSSCKVSELQKENCFRGLSPLISGKTLTDHCVQSKGFKRCLIYVEFCLLCQYSRLKRCSAVVKVSQITTLLSHPGCTRQCVSGWLVQNVAKSRLNTCLKTVNIQTEKAIVKEI
ncbi:unnamed protein product [Moneuplotes crassus]|uniref:Uncharacterized protein n=1 Tax=Euplotes crassus TaxID=5936 RepID=A0AAD1UJD2_EUPCR|nr:unnamed protein product [Moneuplotes crassus]